MTRKRIMNLISLKTIRTLSTCTFTCLFAGEISVEFEGPKFFKIIRNSSGIRNYDNKNVISEFCISCLGL